VEVRLNAPVERDRGAQWSGGGVRTEGGERIPADVVVSNADPSLVYTRMIAPRTAAPHRPERCGGCGSR
jgi:phytoene dehydrogenase-like protein